MQMFMSYVRDVARRLRLHLRSRPACCVRNTYDYHKVSALLSRWGQIVSVGLAVLVATMTYSSLLVIVC